MSIVVENLRVELTKSGLPLVSDVGFTIEPGKVLGLVGESGSGKTTVSLAMLGYARSGTRIAAGSRIRIDGTDILDLSPAETRARRGRLVAYVPQDPGASLNPAMSVGEQLIEGLVSGSGAIARHEAMERVASILESVSLPSTPEFLGRFPSQLSGGQQQRIVIAMALAGHPRLIVLDEPTTGLDVSTQKEVLELVSRLCSLHRIAAIYVSHDLAVISHVADAILVLYAGRTVEVARSSELFRSPAHPYTRALLRSLPSLREARVLEAIPGRTPSVQDRGQGCTFRDRCALADAACQIEPALQAGGSNDAHQVRCHYSSKVQSSGAVSVPVRPTGRKAGDSLFSARNLSASYGTRSILRDVSFELAAGECLAIVGESGSGKSTLSRCIVGLHHRWGGVMTLGGRELAHRSRDRHPDLQRRIQYIFQNPYGSLNPRRTIGSSLSLVLSHFSKGKPRDLERQVAEALDRVALPPSYANRFPNELSGGEKQRAAIARALICRPDVLVCDEVTSALDVSVQAAIVELLRSLMGQGLGMIFVTHNLGVVRSLADQVAVLDKGSLVECDTTDRVLSYPQAPYTRQLLSNSLEVEQSKSVEVTYA